MDTFATPMMKQYLQIKKQYADCLLFFRMGDFYELFFDDAHTGAKVLGITLTGRPSGKQGRIPMAGVPFHAVDSYLAKLVKAGYKVAICEQMTEPDKHGIVDREVIRIVTPGTVVDEKSLIRNRNNYIIAVSMTDKTLGIAAADISTGHFQAAEFPLGNMTQIMSDELARFTPSECIVPEDLYNHRLFLKTVSGQKGLNVFCFHDWNRHATGAEQLLKKHFSVQSLIGFGLSGKKQAIESAAALIGYLKHTQKDHIGHIQKITTFGDDSQMVLDRSTMSNLELFSTLRDHDVKGSLIGVMDKTVTPMGGRMLTNWMAKPLIDRQAIVARHDAVEVLLKAHEHRSALREILAGVWDIERIIAKLAVGVGNARDLVALKLSLQSLISIRRNLGAVSSSLIDRIRDDISPVVEQVISCIDKALVDDPPFDLKEGGLIRQGVNTELDRLREIVGGGRSWILQLEREERERTGISSLKVRYNKVFGFYIEVSKSNLGLVPANYIRKQTLVNGERYITPELKDKEELILSSEERMHAIEYELYLDVLQAVLSHTEQLQRTAAAAAICDCLLSFAELAYKNRYVRPTITDTETIRIHNGRHPVVERLLDDEQFVPNSVALNDTDHQLLVITGPNMAGKSVFIRQVALIVLMAQMGSFVPATAAEMGVVDRIYVRSGASDVITAGLSTFMVEMVETAHILHHATSKSLIIMDEIGRGTSTYDGISIAWSVAEYLVSNQKLAPKTLFATHYHELQALETCFVNKIRNYHVAVEERDGIPVFLHTVRPGGASHSFGVAVAKLAGVPAAAVKRATEMLHTLESRDGAVNKTQISPSASQQQTTLLKEKLDAIDIHTITPLEALNILATLKES